ncbi:site-specific DNA-methyltransferase, partial [Xenorhabdus sp. psl]|nr:site-specific DNA-methyltransferase [Xenorhabdus sp. psl]
MNLSDITLINDDSLQFIKTLPDNCIDLIATDP